MTFRVVKINKDGSRGSRNGAICTTEPEALEYAQARADRTGLVHVIEYRPDTWEHVRSVRPNPANDNSRGNRIARARLRDG